MIQRYSAQSLGPRGAGDLTRSPRKGIGAAAGDYCSGGCPVDGEGRVRHACGYPAPANVQVFTTIVDINGSGTGSVTYQVTSKQFCPEFFMVDDSHAPFLIIEDILDPNGDSLLLGPNEVMAEFFSAKNDRGNRIEGCCISGGLSITVNFRNTLAQEIFNVQGSFWGAIR